MSISTPAHNRYGRTYNQSIVDAPQSKTERAYFFGAVGVSEGEIIETVRKSAKTPSFLLLLREIEQHYPYDRILVVLGNGAVRHYKRVGRFFDKKDNMRLLFMPPSSPELNPEGYVRNRLRNKLLNNRNFKSIKQIGYVIGRFTDTRTCGEARSIATMMLIEALLSVQK